MLFTPRHPSWQMQADKLKRLIELRYNTPVSALTVAADLGGLRRDVWRADRRHVSLGRKHISGWDAPMPLGAVSDYSFQLQQPGMFGAIAATFAPGAHSPWRRIIEEGPAPDPEHLRAAILLDNVRAEMVEARKNPGNRPLMQVFGGQVLQTSDMEETPFTAVERMLLGVWARSIAGVFTGWNEEWWEKLALDRVENVCGIDTLRALTRIVRQALDADGTNPAEMLGWGKKWSDAMNEAVLADESPLSLESGCDLAGENIEQAGMEQVRLLQIMYPPAQSPAGRKFKPSTMKEWEHELEEDVEHDDDSPYESEKLETTSSTSMGIPESRWLNYRNPTDVEIRRSIDMSHQLRNLRYRMPHATVTSSQIPHGRLDTRQLVQFTAQRTMGTEITATPWKKPINQATEQPGLTCAIVLDTSMSMGTFRKELTSLNWVLAQATTTVGGTLSSWGFGGDAFEIVRAGTQPRQVPDVVDSGAGSTGAARALAHAANDANLEAATGTRIAVVVTDAALDESEAKQLSGVFATLSENGVHTILLHVGNSRKSAGIDGAEVVACPWGADLAPILTDRIVSLYAAA